MTKKIFIQMFMIATLLVCSGCVSAFRFDGPYKGKVVDAETKQPMEGVVVLGVWNKVYGNVAGSTSEFYDSIEILTDKNGEFNIPGKGLLLFSFLDEMDVVIYKAGYDMLGYGPWSSFKTRTAMKFVQWNDNIPTFLLKKLSYEERKKNDLSRPNIDQKRLRLLTDEINKERVEFGYNPL
jgi:hypothetical protein